MSDTQYILVSFDRTTSYFPMHNSQFPVRVRIPRMFARDEVYSYDDVVEFITTHANPNTTYRYFIYNELEGGVAGVFLRTTDFVKFTIGLQEMFNKRARKIKR